MTPFGERVEISSGAMPVHRSGSGPSVVFLPGGGMSGAHCWKAHALVAEFATAVSYDRLGLGWSDAVELPRSGTQVSDDLRELLRTARAPGPFVLVGHSLGGLHARLHAKRFAGEVAGLVLLDPTHEDITGYLPEAEAKRLDALNPDALPGDEHLDPVRARYRAAFERAMAEWPAEIREPLLERGFSRDGYRNSSLEPLNLPRVFDEVRQAGPDPDLPTIFLSAMGPDPVADELVPPEARKPAAERGLAKHRLYCDLAATLPRAEVRRLDDAGHSTALWAGADAVADAVRDVLRSAGPA
ncbi:alpha/beta fold hydrolase [Saccharopolyspora dendranthemae]|uniref:Pimeloyl-ACP methyl ester carboxylesterase n=1 Tax=Saccharopolyspora dendranthemae TaxID=1181886 RepID=A0A561U3M6_9PSEU|nr:alpha/beta fold hydrolase [Saccharopolyspora dendranthemae]TWF93947.1 pimeloyl-ACP methyl ester carboxylesterase [Saccharopolyspora dendranthemae]